MSQAKPHEQTSDKHTNTLYERVTDKHWICNNCFRRRQHPVAGRDHEHTTVGYVYSESVSDRKTIFCECSYDSAYVCEWPDILPPDRQKDLFANLARSLDQQGFAVQKPVVFHHLVRYLDESRSEGEFDEWLHQRLPDITED